MEVIEEDVVIVGGGIAGLATAIGLKRVGVRALVLERSDELRATGAAIGLLPNAWRALDALGVAHKLTPIYPILSEGFVTDMVSGQVQSIRFPIQRDGEIGARIVHRKTLLKALAEELSPDVVRFSSKLASITQNHGNDSSMSSLHMEDGTIINTKVLIGCDGVHSKVAQWLGLSNPIDSGRIGIRGLSVYPQGHGLKHHSQQFVNGGVRAGFVPLSSTDVYWFFVGEKSFFEGGGEARRAPELIQKDVLENMAKEFPTIYREVVQHSDLSMLTLAPLMLRLPWELIFGTTCKGAVTVAGDAFHPMTPDLGQGGCSALEDAVVLSRCIGNIVINEGSIGWKEVKEALVGYVNERKWRAAGLITGAYLSGWVQEGGARWWVKFMRDQVFYRFFMNWVSTAVQFDCGKLPLLPSDAQKK